MEASLNSLRLFLRSLMDFLSIKWKTLALFYVTIVFIAALIKLIINVLFFYGPHLQYLR